MKPFISILRGINVSGKNLIKMAALKTLYESLNFENVQTYVQSGNVIFAANATDLKILENKITTQIKKDFGFDVPVIVLTADRLGAIIKHNPFTKDNKKDHSFLHVTFLANIPTEINRIGIEAKKLAGEEIEFAEDVIYLYCPSGYGKTKLNNNFLENKLKVIATTRNWKTVNEILEIVKEYS